jgi:hypothetical protein
VPHLSRQRQVGPFSGLSVSQSDRQVLIYTVNRNQNLTFPLIERTAAPWPVLRIFHKLSFHRIHVHVIELFHFLLLAPHIEIVKAPLPELRKTSVVRIEVESSLRCGCTSASLGPQPPRDPLFQDSQDGRRSSPRGFGDEQVDVFGHHDVTDEFEPVPGSDLTENSDESVAGADGTEERKAPVATERDEVQVAEAVDALETLGHESGTKGPTLRCAKDGAPVTAYSPITYRDGIMCAPFAPQRE